MSNLFINDYQASNLKAAKPSFFKNFTGLKMPWLMTLRSIDYQYLEHEPNLNLNLNPAPYHNKGSVLCCGTGMRLIPDAVKCPCHTAGFGS